MVVNNFNSLFCQNEIMIEENWMKTHHNPLPSVPEGPISLLETIAFRQGLLDAPSETKFRRERVTKRLDKYAKGKAKKRLKLTMNNRPSGWIIRFDWIDDLSLTISPLSFSTSTQCLVSLRLNRWRRSDEIYHFDESRRHSVDLTHNGTVTIDLNISNGSAIGVRRSINCVRLMSSSNDDWR